MKNVRNKDFENFVKTGSIEDYLKYKTKEKNDGVKGRNNSKDHKL